MLKTHRNVGAMWEVFISQPRCAEFGRSHLLSWQHLCISWTVEKMFSDLFHYSSKGAIMNGQTNKLTGTCYLLSSASCPC